MKDLLEVIKKILQEIKISSQLAPIISGSASLLIINRIILSNLEGDKFAWSISIIFLMFIASVVLYYFLRKFEKNKDVYLLSVIGRTVGDVFKRYGQQMAAKNAEHAKAEDMNKIMCTIVNLVKSMKSLENKRYE